MTQQHDQVDRRISADYGMNPKNSSRINTIDYGSSAEAMQGQMNDLQGGSTSPVPQLDPNNQMNSQRGQSQLGQNIHKSNPGDPYSYHDDQNMNSQLQSLDRSKFDEDKMLIEQDPFLLEEQRYLSKLQKANYKQELAYKVHETNVVQPTLKKKLDQEHYENEIIQRRNIALQEAQDRQAKMKRDITRMNHDAIQRQVAQNQIEKMNFRSEKARQDE